MPAPFAARRGQRLEPAPAAPAYQSGVAVAQQSIAHRACPREEKIEGGRRSVPQGDQRSALMAFHMASRSGALPNQRSKARAPCSTSIVMPSCAW